MDDALDERFRLAVAVGGGFVVDQHGAHAGPARAGHALVDVLEDDAFPRAARPVFPPPCAKTLPESLPRPPASSTESGRVETGRRCRGAPGRAETAPAAWPWPPPGARRGPSERAAGRPPRRASGARFRGTRARPCASRSARVSSHGSAQAVALVGIQRAFRGSSCRRWRGRSPASGSRPRSAKNRSSTRLPDVHAVQQACRPDRRWRRAWKAPRALMDAPLAFVRAGGNRASPARAPPRNSQLWRPGYSWYSYWKGLPGRP